MLEPSQNFTIWKYDHDSHKLETLCRPIVVEHACQMIVNDEKWLSFICSPDNLEALGVGFLWNEAIITDLTQIDNIALSDDKETLSIHLNSAVEKPTHFHRTSTGIAVDLQHSGNSSMQAYELESSDLIKLYRDFNNLQELHGSVGGFHSAALSDGQNINILVEDLGRHNCIDKLSGLYLQSGKKFNAHLLLISGRISSEMVAKSMSLGVQILVSRTSPTSLAIQIAQKTGITLVGYLRGHQYYIYTHPERVII